MKRVMSLILVLLLVVGMTACGSGDSSTAGTSTSGNVSNAVLKADGTPIEIAWIGKTLNNPWWVSVADFAQKEANSLGVKLTIALPQEEVDLEKQVTMVEAAIERNVDAIIISATSSDGIIPSIKKARDAGIKIVNFDTRISDPSMYDAFVGGDDVDGAYKAGKYICEQLGGEGEVGLITGLLAQSTGTDRKAGFMKAVAEYPGIKVVAEASAEWRSDLAANVTENMLTANPKIQAIFACNDQMAVGMANTVKTKGYQPDDLILVGYDGILDAVNMVLNEDLDAFVALPNLDEGATAVRLATALVLNPDYTYDREMIFDTPLVTYDYIPGLTDWTIFEFSAITFPLKGITEKGY